MKKGKFKVLTPHYETFHVWVNRALSSVKQGRGSQEAREGKCKDTQGQIPTSEGSYPHPGRAGSCRSPASRPCTRPSEQGPGIPTPPERIWWPHPRRPTVPEMKTHFTKEPWGDSYFHTKWEEDRGVRINSVEVNILTDPCKAIWRKLSFSNLIS